MCTEKEEKNDNTEKKRGTSLTFPLFFFSLPPAVCTFIAIYSFLANWILLSLAKCKHTTRGVNVMDFWYHWSLFVV